MRTLLRIGFAVSASAFAIPVAAFAQAPSSFDGTYAGVSGTTGQGGTVNCPPMSTPAPLTIAGGNVTSSVADSFHGTVSPDGRVVLHGKGDIRYDGKIENGTLTAGGGTPRCTFTFVWRKR